jgi:hypothetical protein
MSSQNVEVRVDVRKILEQLGIDPDKWKQQCGLSPCALPPVNGTPLEPS